MAELLNLRLHIGPIEGRKFRECKVTLDTKLMFGTEPFTPQGCCPIVSQMALPADAAAVRVRILDMEKIVNLDHQVGGFG